LLTIFLYGWGDWDVVAVALLIAAGAFVTGGIFGFLFGIPRALAAERPLPARRGETERLREGTETETASRYAPNTNLEQISDWLTKILVGVGLVQFSAIAGHLGDLVDSLGPAFGGDPYGKSVAGATLAIFSVSGFLVFYLITRIHLGSALAHADEQMLNRLEKKLDEVRDSQANQQELDVQAVTLIQRQLDPEPGAPPISQTDLDNALAAASPLVKTQIFALAREQRKLNWRDDKARMERAIPVFRALIAAEDEQKFHRNHAQLGYALKDKDPADHEKAEIALTEAIELRDDAGERGFLLYEYNRALARMGRRGTSPTSQERAAIEADLSAAEQSAAMGRLIAKDPVIAKFRGTGH